MGLHDVQNHENWGVPYLKRQTMTFEPIDDVIADHSRSRTSIGSVAVDTSPQISIVWGKPNLDLHMDSIKSMNHQVQFNKSKGAKSMD